MNSARCTKIIFEIKKKTVMLYARKVIIYHLLTIQYNCALPVFITYTYTRQFTTPFVNQISLTSQHIYIYI